MTETVPTIEVVSGDPTPEELAALVVVLRSRPAAAPGPAPQPPTGWSAYWRRHRGPLQPRVGGWQASAWR